MEGRIHIEKPRSPAIRVIRVRMVRAWGVPSTGYIGGELPFAQKAGFHTGGGCSDGLNLSCVGQHHSGGLNPK